MNCLDKLNPAERLILESVCTDCKADTVLTYRWSLLSFTALGKETEVTGFSVMTTTGINQANIAVKGNILESGQDYSLKISAWKPGGEKGTFFLFPEWQFHPGRIEPHISSLWVLIASESSALFTTL